jgi:hypothetical protein
LRVVRAEAESRETIVLALYGPLHLPGLHFDDFERLRTENTSRETRGESSRCGGGGDGCVCVTEVVVMTVDVTVVVKYLGAPTDHEFLI